MNWVVQINHRKSSIRVGETELCLGVSLEELCTDLQICIGAFRSTSVLQADSDVVCYDTSGSNNDSSNVNKELERVLVSPVVGVVYVAKGIPKGTEILLQAPQDEGGVTGRRLGEEGGYGSVTLFMPMWQTELCFCGDGGSGCGPLVLQAIYVADEREAGVEGTSTYHSRRTIFEQSESQVTIPAVQHTYGAKNVKTSNLGNKGCRRQEARIGTHTFRAVFKTIDAPASLVSLSLPSYHNNMNRQHLHVSENAFAASLLDELLLLLPTTEKSVTTTTVTTAPQHTRLSNEKVLILPGVGIVFCPSGISITIKQSSMQYCLDVLGEPSVTLITGRERRGDPWVDAHDGTAGVAVAPRDLDASNPITLVYLNLGMDICVSGCHQLVERVVLHNSQPQSVTATNSSIPEDYQIWCCSNELGDVLGFDVAYKRPHFALLLDLDLLSYFHLAKGGVVNDHHCQHHQRANVTTATNWTSWAQVSAALNTCSSSQLERLSGAADKQLYGDLLADLLSPVDGEVVLDGVAIQLSTDNSKRMLGDTVLPPTQWISRVSVFGSTSGTFAQIGREVVGLGGGASLFGSRGGLELISNLLGVRHSRKNQGDEQPEELPEEVEEQPEELPEEVEGQPEEQPEEVEEQPEEQPEEVEEQPEEQPEEVEEQPEEQPEEVEEQPEEQPEEVEEQPEEQPEEVEEQPEELPEEVEEQPEEQPEEVEEQPEELPEEVEEQPEELPEEVEEQPEEVEEQPEEQPEEVEEVPEEQAGGGGEHSHHEVASSDEQRQEVVDSHELNDGISPTPPPDAQSDGSGSIPFDFDQGGHEEDQDGGGLSEGKIKHGAASLRCGRSDNDVHSSSEEASTRTHGGSSWAAIAHLSTTPADDDCTSERMDSNRYATCATEEGQTPDATANTPEFASHYGGTGGGEEGGDSSSSQLGHQGLIGRGMAPVVIEGGPSPAAAADPPSNSQHESDGEEEEAVTTQSSRVTPSSSSAAAIRSNSHPSSAATGNSGRPTNKKKRRRGKKQ